MIDEMTGALSVCVWPSCGIRNKFHKMRSGRNAKRGRICLGISLGNPIGLGTPTSDDKWPASFDKQKHLNGFYVAWADWYTLILKIFSINYILSSIFDINIFWKLHLLGCELPLTSHRVVACASLFVSDSLTRDEREFCGLKEMNM